MKISGDRYGQNLQVVNNTIATKSWGDINKARTKCAGLYKVMTYCLCFNVLSR